MLRSLDAISHRKTLIMPFYGIGKSACPPGHYYSAIPSKIDGKKVVDLNGDSEGYYVHIGVMVDFGDRMEPGKYFDLGFVKLWDPKTAQTLATEAQRFLSATRWN